MAILRPPPPPLDATGFVSSAWQQWFSRLPASIENTASVTTISQTSSGQKYAGSGAIINRLNDRLFIAEATANDGANPNVVLDWLSSFQVAAGASAGSLAFAQAGILSGASSSTLSAAWLVGAQSLGAAAVSEKTIAGQFYSINSNQTLATKAWAVYAEAHKTYTSVGITTAAEFSTRTLFTSAIGTPYTAGVVTGLTLSSGCGLAAAGQFDASVGLQFLANPMKFGVGISFGATSLTGTDGTGSGSAVAIALAQGHKLNWYNSAGTLTSSIFGNVATATKATRLLHDDTGFSILDANDAPMATFPYLNTPVNYPALISAATTGTVQITATGTDTNIPVRLDSKGTGQVVLGHTGMKVRFGTYVAGVVAGTGTILIEDYSGTVYKLIVAT